MSQKENNEVLLPTNDLIFKTIYGKEGSESITEDFIKYNNKTNLHFSYL